VDIQRRMLDMLTDRVAKEGLTNFELVLAGLGEGRLAVKGFDIALLVTVLGEIPDKLAALREIINVFGRRCSLDHGSASRPVNKQKPEPRH
jgi:ubiquinone/menaquinone biosynthesis C-methylase UbiE